MTKESLWSRYRKRGRDRNMDWPSGEDLWALACLVCTFVLWGVLGEGHYDAPTDNRQDDQASKRAGRDSDPTRHLDGLRS